MKSMLKLLSVDLGAENREGDLEIENQECTGGACPVK